MTPPMPDKLLFTRTPRFQVFEIALFLSLATLFFYIFGTQMAMFGVFIYVGLAWLVYSTPNRKLCLMVGLLGGTIGALTEAWGCFSGFWNWTQPCISLLMIGGNPTGFPIEVVVAYFSAGFWIGKVTLILFKDSVTDVQEKFANGANKFNIPTIHAALIVVLNCAGIALIFVEPLFLQSILLLTCGISIFSFLPGRVMKRIISIIIFMGFAGFFFENFATGIVPGFSVWEYNPAAYVNLTIPIPFVGVAPVSAWVAYTGCGFLLFSGAFLLAGRAPVNG
ncbi:MAG: hypothetical protein ACTSUE_24135 [Promethearchaeota archaeon]